MNPVQELGNLHDWRCKFSASLQAGLGVHIEVGLSGGATVSLEGDFLKILLIASTCLKPLFLYKPLV